MSEPAQRFSTETFLADVARLLPVRELRAVLCGVADAWRRNSPAVAVLLGVPTGLVGIARGEEPPEFREVDPADLPRSEDRVHRLLDDAVFQDAVVRRVDLPEPDADFSLHLVLPPGTEASVPAEWCELTAGLLRQAELAEDFAARLEQDEQARLEEKLEALAEFAAGAGHEINNPLATITGRANQLLKDETDPDRRRALATIGGQALRVRDMIGDTMLFARPPEPDLQSVAVGDAIAAVISKLQPAADERGCRVSATVDEPLLIHADPDQFSIVVENLLRNAFEAVADNVGEVDVACTPAAQPGFALLTVADNGRGLTATDRRHLFDPFYSGRQAGRGLGFGLCKCRRIVSNHGGRIDVDSQPGRTTFRVFWPLCETTC